MSITRTKTFEEFIDTIKETNIDPSFYYTNYQTVAKHMDRFRAAIDFLGTINSKKDFIEKVKSMIDRNPDDIEIIPLFSAIRPDQLIVLSNNKQVKKFNKENVTFEESMKFLEEVGFLEKIDELKPFNAKSYFFGVNVGMDTHGRKNRSGKKMENIVDGYMKSAKLDFLGQATIENLNDKWNEAFKWNSPRKKEFDFIIKHKDGYLLVETNFFNTGGSKSDINTSFIKLNEDIKLIKPKGRLEFMLITDGAGLREALTELKDIYDNIRLLFNIDDLQNNKLLEINSDSLPK